MFSTKPVKCASLKIPIFGLSKQRGFIAFGYRHLVAMPAPESEPPKETFLIHDISPELERELMRRAHANGRDPSAEAAALIEKHIEEADGGLA